MFRLKAEAIHQIKSFMIIVRPFRIAEEIAEKLRYPLMSLTPCVSYQR